MILKRPPFLLCSGLAALLIAAAATGCSGAQVDSAASEPLAPAREVPCSDAPAPSSAVPPAPAAEEPAAKAPDEPVVEEPAAEPPAAAAGLGDDGDDGDDESTATRLGRTATQGRASTAKSAP